LADLSDVTAYLYGVSSNAVYPDGIGQPSAAAMDCRIFEGWPIPEQLDQDLAGTMLAGSPPREVPRPGGPVASISVYPMPGTGVAVPQILDETYVIVRPVFGLTLSASGNTVTLAGQPAAGEYITLVCDDLHVYSQTGSTAAALLSALATAAQADYPATAATPTTLTVPVGRKLIVRQGAAGMLGKVTHRQRHSIMVTVWAPTHAVRAALASAIDVAIKKNIRITLPDTSQALVIYSRTNTSDEQQSSTIYRRDLIYDVEYATLETFPGSVITTVNTPLPLSVTAIT
jgi:hypothetical protein